MFSNFGLVPHMPKSPLALRPHNAQTHSTYGKADSLLEPLHQKQGRTCRAKIRVGQTRRWLLGVLSFLRWTEHPFWSQLGRAHQRCLDAFEADVRFSFVRIG